MDKKDILSNKILFSIIAILGIGVLVWVGYLGKGKGERKKEDGTLAKNNNQAQVVQTQENNYVSQLDGHNVQTLEEEAPAVVGIMVDNHVDARPQYGLTEAPIVYETLAEGGITRFFAVFSKDQDVRTVGPVRSARPYYLDWLAEYSSDALYMHCGGSPDALALIKSRGVFNANEFYWGKYYWRSSGNVAPHNLLTSSAKWQQLYTDYGKDKNGAGWSGWKFEKELKNITGEQVSKVAWNFGLNYKVSWVYSPGEQMYERYINGSRHMNYGPQENPALSSYALLPIKAKNVIIQFTKMEVLDEVGRKEVETIGNGEARVMRDGMIIKATWKKNNLSNRTRFYDANNTEIPLSPGNTWIEVVPLNTTLEVTN